MRAEQTVWVFRMPRLCDILACHASPNLATQAAQEALAAQQALLQDHWRKNCQGDRTDFRFGVGGVHRVCLRGVMAVMQPRNNSGESSDSLFVLDRCLMKATQI